MSKFFSAIKNLLTYKESLEEQQFELLEYSENNEKGVERVAEQSYISLKLNENLAYINHRFNTIKSQDIIIREFKIGEKYTAFLVFIDEMVDKLTVNNSILRPLMNTEAFQNIPSKEIVEYISNNVLSVGKISRENKYDSIVKQVLNGMTALFIDNCNEAILIGTKGFEKRNIEKPLTESVIRGAQEGFTEDLGTNIALIRRIIRNEDLIVEILPVGKANNSSCAIFYMDGITNPSLINEAKRRIESIDFDYISGSGMLEEMINDQPLLLFPQISTTERPDKSAIYLLDGKVLFIMDGAPFAGAVPTNFFDLIHSPEDYFLRWQFGTFLRFIRMLGIFASSILPGIYLALILFHHDMVPTDLLFSIAQSRENVPFPTFIELLLMEIAFELIREAGLRVPGAIGTTLGIIGALILGQAAVAASIVSPILIIVVAVTGIGSFATPSYTLAFAIRIARFFFIVLGAAMGFYGISAAIVIILGIMCSMKSFGIPFFTPVAPKTNMRPDVIIGQPLYKQTERIEFTNPVDLKSAAAEPRGWKRRRQKDDK
ncbi:MAG TPA: spore germination protein [Clostridiales bacterium]|nr:spore germination protein [Clostridiales bacterium]